MIWKITLGLSLMGELRCHHFVVRSTTASFARVRTSANMPRFAVRAPWSWRQCGWAQCVCIAKIKWYACNLCPIFLPRISMEQRFRRNWYPSDLCSIDALCTIDRSRLCISYRLPCTRRVGVLEEYNWWPLFSVAICDSVKPNMRP